MSITKKQILKTVLEAKAQIAVDLIFITTARQGAQDQLDRINTKVQDISTRLINLEQYLRDEGLS